MYKIVVSIKTAGDELERTVALFVDGGETVKPETIIRRLRRFADERKYLIVDVGSVTYIGDVYERYD